MRLLLTAATLALLAGCVPTTEKLEDCPAPVFDPKREVQIIEPCAPALLARVATVAPPVPRDNRNGGNGFQPPPPPKEPPPPPPPPPPPHDCKKKCEPPPPPDCKKCGENPKPPHGGPKHPKEDHSGDTNGDDSHEWPKKPKWPDHS